MFALTVVPALCAVVLRPKDADAREPALLVRMRDGYERLLLLADAPPAVVRRRRVGVAAGRGVVASRLGSEFLPELDEGDIVIFVEMPPSISLDEGAASCRTSGSGCSSSRRCSKR